MRAAALVNQKMLKPCVRFVWLSQDSNFVVVCDVPKSHVCICEELRKRCCFVTELFDLQWVSLRDNMQSNLPNSDTQGTDSSVRIFEVGICELQCFRGIRRTVHKDVRIILLQVTFLSTFVLVRPFLILINQFIVLKAEGFLCCRWMNFLLRQCH